MFKKKSCKRCGEKINDKYSFCPKCGLSTNLQPKTEDWGMLGKTDSIAPTDAFEKGIFGGISGRMLNKMLGSAMKALEKEMQRSMNQPPKTNFELYINGKRISPKNIKVTKKPIKSGPVKKKTSQKSFNQNSLKKFTKLPKQEPKTNIRRLSDKVIYEIEIPGVRSIENISIVKLENSIEIKAISDTTAYSKNIKIDLPLKTYKLQNQKLVLELEDKNL